MGWPKCDYCGTELELIRPHTFDECYCEESVSEIKTYKDRFKQKEEVMEEKQYPNWFKTNEKLIAKMIVILTIVSFVGMMFYMIGFTEILAVIGILVGICVIIWAFTKTFPGFFSFGDDDLGPF